MRRLQLCLQYAPKFKLYTSKQRIIIQLLPVIHKKHTRDDYIYIMICLFPAHRETKFNSFPRNKTVG